jgi:tRNA G18 (ribose-2'-O)-methylase SpoU
LERCDVRVTIPLRDGAESLNVAAAAAIALHRIREDAAQAKPSGNPLNA